MNRQGNRMNTVRWTSTALVATAALLTSGAPVDRAYGQESIDSHWLSPTLITARTHRFDPNLNYLTFQHMNKIFPTRTVHASGEVWELPVALRDIDGPLELRGEVVDLKGFFEGTRTNAFLVIKNGRIVHETYRNGSDRSTRFIGFSMSKSILATLIGLALHDGHIENLDDLVTDYLPELKGSGYEGVSIRNVLRMRSGVAWEESYSFGSDSQAATVAENTMVRHNYRWCDYAASESTHGVAPGSVFNYSTLDTGVLGCVLERAVGKKGGEYMAEKLWQPAGMEADAFWIMDGPEPIGREFFGAGVNATLRDFGRFGLMILNGGKANGRQVVPAEWVAAATVPDEGYEPTSPGANRGYQYQWWTLPRSNAFLAVGLHNQYIYIDPDNDLVIVKLSYGGGEEGVIERFEHIGRLLAE
jgi:CubicO group peptidase (beta-lactamase class C family)